MAAPSFVAASTGVTDAGGAWDLSSDITGAVGDIWIVQLLQDGSTAGAVSGYTGSNIETLDGSDNVWTPLVTGQAVGSPTVAYQSIFIGRGINTSAPRIAGSNSTSEDIYIRFYRFTNVSTGTTLATVIENGTAGSTANTAATDGTITDAGVTTLGPDRLALQFIGISDDNALAAFTGETGGNWAEAVSEYAESSGTDATIGLQQAWISSLGAAPYSSAVGSDSILGGSGTKEQLASQFTTVGALTVTHVFASLGVLGGTPTDNIIIEIQTDSGGLPSGTVVGSSGSLAMTELPAAVGAFRNFRIAVSASLSATTTYHIVFRRDGARDATNYPGVGLAGDVVTGGGYETRDSGTWTNTSDVDLAFALLTSTDISGGTVNGGTTTNSDSADGWGVVGFALIGTTVVDTTYYPRYGFVHYNDPAIV